jgi:hypothetical protein
VPLSDSCTNATRVRVGSSVLVVIGQKNGCGRPVCLGDDPDLSVSYAVGREDSRALFQISPVLLCIFRAELAPITLVMSRQ